MGHSKESFFSKEGAAYLPKEEKLAIQESMKKLRIGVIKEKYFQERRVALVPSAVSHLVKSGFEIIVERGAGLQANFTDISYSEVGATIVETSEEAFQVDVVVKIAPPTIKEVELMREKSMIISALHLQNQTVEIVRKMMQKKITALSYEHIRDNSNTHPVLHSISEIVGHTSIMIASNYLSDKKWGRGKMLGGFTGINPSEVIILGAGTVGEYAARAALGFGALVKIFDDSLSKLSKVQNNLNNRIFTSIIQTDVLRKALKHADVVIGALYPNADKSSIIVSKEMVQEMKPGSIIVDVSIDRGGCFETSHETNHANPVYQEEGVTHYCVPNISSRTPHTSSYALSNFLGPFVFDLGQSNGLASLLMMNRGLCNGVYIYNGRLVMEELANKFKLSYQSLELLLASF